MLPCILRSILPWRMPRSARALRCPSTRSRRTAPSFERALSAFAGACAPALMAIPANTTAPKAAARNFDIEPPHRLIAARPVRVDIMVDDLYLSMLGDHHLQMLGTSGSGLCNLPP